MIGSDGNEAVAKVVAALSQSNISYMLVGSYSSNVYGVPRATGDADFVVEMLQDSIAAVVEKLGDDFKVQSQVEFELLTGTTRRVLQFLPFDFAIELFELSDDPFDQSRFERRVSVQSNLLGGTVWLPRPEDVVIQKLRWGRAQDLSDVSDVIAVQGDSLDWSYIQNWTDQHGSSEVLQRIRDEL
ncbi:hypothetical protein LOC71_06115 [Rhodopirellula sp. JC740]|uniref:DUF6036 domain-containing protein n=1 Tax=Rhodopirellula halodulae TaxID=2894198 RepID=A0ABS8NE67_9BACT|nr:MULTISPECIES: DUF6036 family nucleotidyltransferase [unclassified Rhodopirellula]MCC9641843.1 hypothetical protein [Rhodopirellula sp. JC740]MCC9654834.1 hypothetical protein [Rhodopirellula sp. JC737]